MTTTYNQAIKTKAALLYFYTSATATEIAKRLGVSQPSVCRWAKERNPVRYEMAKFRNHNLLQALDILEVQPNVRASELARMVGVSRSLITRWQQDGRIVLDLVCKLCGEESETVFCQECMGKNWDRLHKRYGLDYHQLISLPTACEVCGETENLHIDHNHTTGKYRGVLCQGCNLALGHAKDNISTLENLIKYLKRN